MSGERYLQSNVHMPIMKVVTLRNDVDVIEHLIECVFPCVIIMEIEFEHPLGSPKLDHELHISETRFVREICTDINTEVAKNVRRDVHASEMGPPSSVAVEIHGSVVGWGDGPVGDMIQGMLTNRRKDA